MKNKKAFTLIELVSVLVILAILTLIVTPLVLNIIKKARIAADKRSIDAYGRSIELAIAGYLLDNGDFPDSINDLTIEYSGDEVVCSTTRLNEDSSVYLAECTVGGRSVEGYTYGTDKTEEASYTAYSIGNIVQYNGVQYYVIADSAASESTVTLLKAEPLSVSEVNQYGTGHVNMYITTDPSASCYRQASDINGYGGMAYYSSATCSYIGSNWVYDGCTTSYAQSEIKYVVDAWKEATAPLAREARLITIDEVTNLGYEWYDNGSVAFWQKTENTPSWVYNNNYGYWTMSPYEDSASYVWSVYYDGGLNNNSVDNYYGNVVRPVIVLSKSSLSS